MHNSPFAPMGSPRMTSAQKEAEKISGLTFIERIGDVSFYRDAKGKQFQQLGCDEPFRVKDGKVAYKEMHKVNGVTIKYQLNGCNGFSLFKGRKLMEDNIWKFADATRIASELGWKSRPAV